MQTDVAIVGAGLVGASLARALEASGLNLALLEASAPPARTGAWDERIYAFSPASVAFLDALGVWGALDSERICPVRKMRIYGDNGRSRLEFSAYAAGLDALAWIVESGEVQRALWRGIERQANLKLLFPARPVSLEVGEHWASLAADSGEEVAARLLVGADGAASWLRKAGGFGARSRPYRQQAVVANFACERPHRSVALQFFRGDGILAYLPLPGNRVSIVWSTSEPNAEELLALAPGELAGRVAEAGREQLGQLELITAPAAFPLALLSVNSMLRPRLALIGDAAHVVHPLAGQGVNLGFGDARALAATLAARRPGSDPGEWLLLRRFERVRAEDILAMRWVTDGLQRLFGARWPGVAWLRNFGLNLTDSAPVIKASLVRHAAG
ncbi:MAG: UbiH/UbiF family hydroxylase [Betaproteobacteria bacterium]|nr:UbiH/UbiF family hydroxylase [Betaproteobacteria bacterium]MBI2960104.1 UbiH/UbiF family hydroxylase [Betaproteobacteria bacterium]